MSSSGACRDLPINHAHIIAGPLALASGLALMSESLRRRFPAGHRRLGRVLVLGVLLVVAPSGLWMARYAATGAVAGMAFATLAIATALCAAHRQGYKGEYSNSVPT